MQYSYEYETGFLVSCPIKIPSRQLLADDEGSLQRQNWHLPAGRQEARFFPRGQTFLYALSPLLEAPRRTTKYACVALVAASRLKVIPGTLFRVGGICNFKR